MRTDDFDYDLPKNLIAQSPAPERDQSRLLVYRRASGFRTHHRFRELPQFLQPADVLVLNDSKVIPARMFGRKTDSRGEIELLMVEKNDVNDFWVMLRPGRRVRIGTVIELQDRAGRQTAISAIIVERNSEGHCRIRFTGTPDISRDLDELGHVPLPPYIEREQHADRSEDRYRYQTVFARQSGSVAAPTAGLHFTEDLLGKIRAIGVSVCFVTLHIGPGTFLPVKTDCIEDHIMHRERFQIGVETASLIKDAKRLGRRIIAVGTTALRVLESVAAANDGQVNPSEGRTGIFIRPPYHFHVVDALITNFHLPRSTLLMLVSAFGSPGDTCGRDAMLGVYGEAMRERYRFYSYGDAMLII